MGFNGVFSTPMTPFGDDAELALEHIDPYLQWQAASGVSGIYVLGTWGGFATMSLDERRTATEAYCASAHRHGLKIIVHIGTYCERETLELAQHAVDHGADAVSSLLPLYYSTADYLRADDYRRYFGRLVERIDAPLYLYNNPRTTGVLLSPEDFIPLARAGLAGVKDGSKSVAWIIKTQQQLADEGLQADIIPGNTVGLLYGRLYGCGAVTSGASVVFPGETVEIHRRLDAGDVACAVEQHRLVLQLRSALGLCSAAPSAAHRLLTKIGHHLGRPRPLWPAVDDALLDDIEAAVDKARCPRPDA